MNIKQYFDYNKPTIPADRVYEITESVLDDLYVSSDDGGKFNVFFHLLNEYHFLNTQGLNDETAYVCYLLSYYLFNPLTPPHSMPLALHYANEAVRLHGTEKYKEWANLVERGN